MHSCVEIGDLHDIKDFSVFCQGVLEFGCEYMFMVHEEVYEWWYLLYPIYSVRILFIVFVIH